jgi:hypothetical protein
MSQQQQPQSHRIQIIIALIGAASAIVVAIIGGIFLLASKTPTPTPMPTPIPTSTPSLRLQPL